MCLWVELPPHVDSLEVYQRALEAKISVTPGPLFSAKRKFHNFLRLNSVNPWSETVEHAMRTLGQIIAGLAPMRSVLSQTNGHGRTAARA